MDIITIIMAVYFVRLNTSDNNSKIVLKYLLIVFVTSVLLNLPKFMETSASWGDRMVLNTSCVGEEAFETSVKLSVTWLRMNTTYIHVFSIVR